MKYAITYLILVLTFIMPQHNYAQKDLFEGILDKEEPVFTPTITAGDRDGTAQLMYYFTHSRASEIEISLWIKDMGTNLMSQADKRMVRGLKMVGNRKMDTLTLDGLKPGHFYAIGVDYRYPNSLARKFNSKILREAYLYEGTTLQARSVDTPQQPVIEKPKQPSDIPCINPDLFVKIDPAGYCGTQNRPAVLIQCENCHGKSWEFSVEARTEYGNWEPLRSDGMAHTALGASVRTEPLCVMAPGTYYLRVLAWGENCKTPVVNTIGTSITIGPGGTQPTSTFNEPPSPPSYQNDGRPAAVLIPESCDVIANAQLEGPYIRGSVELPLGSECENWRSHVMISYIHPGYRDINLEAIPLHAGIEMPFELELDQQDLQRGIHTLKATVYMSGDGYPRPFAAETFWIRAEENSRAASVMTPNLQPYEPAEYNNKTTTRRGTQQPNDYEVLNQNDPAMHGTITNSGVEWDGDYSIDESLYEQNEDALQVTASDPNCTQIQGLQLVASPTQPDKPLYISWLSPRCCQEEGCEYSVWAGQSPQQISLLVKGNKSGATVSELLSTQQDASYYEVVVRTANGTRKAAYVPGQGPIYGIEQVLAYRDKFQPQHSDPVVGARSTDQTRKGMVSGGLADRMGDGTPASSPVSYEQSAGLYQQPQMPISKFRPCKYVRQTTLEADLPIYEGDEITIAYDFSEPGHQYTLYHQPLGSEEWFIAPGTRELQTDPEFDIEAQSYHSGKYLLLVYKMSKNWGCLSAPQDNPLDINVIR